MAKRKEYRLHGRDKTYRINGKGEFFVMGRFSPTWKIYGVASRWNGHPSLWPTIKKQLDKGKTIVGYLYDMDHGTRRFWGGSWHGKLPKVTLYKA